MVAEGSNQGPNLERSWLSDVQCRGPEATVAECSNGQEFLAGATECESGQDYYREVTISAQLYVACRHFPVVEALEGEVTPGAGEHSALLISCMGTFMITGVPVSYRCSSLMHPQRLAQAYCNLLHA